MDNICEFCTSCRVCELSCPKNAITIKENVEGFLSPVINNEKCIECGICKKVCPQNKEWKRKDYYGKAYAVQILDNNILLNSTSGGFFTALAIETLKKDGIICGVAMCEDLRPKYILVDKVEELAQLRGSKYLASDVNYIYKEVKQYLDEGKEILFSGLPCQVAGLKSYLKKEYQNLITVDLICHGTPNYKLFDTYVKAMEEKKNSKMLSFKFRDKTKFGWGVYWTSTYENKRIKRGGLNDDSYISAFIKGNANKEACYKCKYVGFENRPGDITLGDYWGIDKFHKEMISNKGVSAVIVNSMKASDLVQKALKQCKYVESKKEYIATYNKSLVCSTVRPKIRDSIYNGIYEKKPYEFIKENLRVSKKDFIKTKIRLMIPYKLRVLIKKIRK